VLILPVLNDLYENVAFPTALAIALGIIGLSGFLLLGAVRTPTWSWIVASVRVAFFSVALIGAYGVYIIGLTSR
jgi:hypothetical protein